MFKQLKNLETVLLTPVQTETWKKTGCIAAGTYMLGKIPLVPYEPVFEGCARVNKNLVKT
jgi:hypothetical protein